MTEKRAVAPDARKMASHWPSRKRRRQLGSVARTLVAIVVAVVVIFPLYWMVAVAFSTRRDLFSGALRFWPHSWTTANFHTIFAQYPISTWFGNSVAIALVTALITVLFNLLAGYAFAMIRFRGRTLLFFASVSTLMLPVQVIMVPLFNEISVLHLYGTYWAVILPTSASAFGLFLARQFMVGLPVDVVEAARLDGAGHLRLLRSVIVPMSKPLIAVLFFTSLLQSWNDFAWPLIALKQNSLFTLPIGLLYLQGQYGSDYGAIMAFALLSVAPVVILFVVAQRFFIQSFAGSGMR